MADYEALVFETRDDGRIVTVTNPTARPITSMVLEQRRPFGSVWDGAEELVHVVRGAFVTVRPLPPGARGDAPLHRGAAGPPPRAAAEHQGPHLLDARRDPATGETRIRVKVCRAQPLAVEGVDPDGVYRVQVDGEPARLVLPRVTRTIQALLSKQTAGAARAAGGPPSPGRCASSTCSWWATRTASWRHTVRVVELPPAEAAAARARILAAIPPRTGRVT